MPVLSVRDLEVTIGQTKILRGISFDLEAGETLGIVGESGCGKTMLGNTLMGMLPPGGRITGGSIQFEGKNLAELSGKQWLDIRGAEIAMVMQDPFTALNPLMRVGDQVAESLLLHQEMNKEQAQSAAAEMLRKVGIPEPDESYRKFPHQMSGGQRQRVVIAIAYACRPKVLICDEPTTALDVTLQAQILELLRDLQRDADTAIILVSHNVGVIAAMSDHIGVIYAGKLIEDGTAKQVLENPRHPYTKGLLDALPHLNKERLKTIPGQPPDFKTLGTDCSFRPRCPFAHERCVVDPPALPAEPEHEAKCWLVDEGVNI